MGYFSRLDALVNDILTSKLSTEQQAEIFSQLLLHVSASAVCEFEVMDIDLEGLHREIRESKPIFFDTARRINKLLEGTGIWWEGSNMKEGTPAVTDSV